MIGQANTIGQPLVSVIIPTHNRSESLVRALESLKIQTYSNIEVVIVDDASSDDTSSKVRLFEKQLRILYLRSDSTRGVSRSRNIGLQKASGEYIALLDDDDEFLEKKIEIQVKAAISLNKKVFILCNGYTFGKKNPYAYDLRKPSGFICWKENFFPARFELPPPSAWFFHREVVDKIGYFDEAMYIQEDIDYCLRLMKQYPVYMINELLLNWHTTPNSLSNAPRISMEYIGVRKYFLEKHFDLMKHDRHYLYKFYWRMGKDLKKLGEITDAAKYFRKAISVKPYKFEALAQLISLSFPKHSAKS